MGIVTSKFDNRHKKENNNIKSIFDPTQGEPILTEREGTLLRDVWGSIQEDIHRVGVVTFVR